MSSLVCSYVILPNSQRQFHHLLTGEIIARNKEYLQLAVDYAEAVVVTAELLRPFPDWMKRYESQNWAVSRHELQLFPSFYQG